jgi:hypothetical protein
VKFERGLGACHHLLTLGFSLLDDAWQYGIGAIFKRTEKLHAAGQISFSRRGFLPITQDTHKIKSWGVTHRALTFSEPHVDCDGLAGIINIVDTTKIWALHVHKNNKLSHNQLRLLSKQVCRAYPDGFNRGTAPREPVHQSYWDEMEAQAIWLNPGDTM